MSRSQGTEKDDEALNKEWEEGSIGMTGQGKEMMLEKSRERRKALRTTAGKEESLWKKAANRRSLSLMQGKMWDTVVGCNLGSQTKQEMILYSWVQSGLGADLDNVFLPSILSVSEMTTGGPRRIPVVVNNAEAI